MVEKLKLYMENKTDPFVEVMCRGYDKCPLFKMAKDLGVGRCVVQDWSCKHVFFNEFPDMNNDTIAACMRNQCINCKQRVR